MGAGVGLERPARLTPAAACYCLLLAATPLVFLGQLYEPHLGPKEALLRAGAGLVAAVWILSLRGAAEVAATPLWRPVLALALAAGLSVWRLPDRAIALERSEGLFFAALLLGAALGIMRAREARDGLSMALTAAGAMAGLFVVLQFLGADFSGLRTGMGGKWAAFGTFGNPNWTGEFLAAAGLIAAGRLAQRRSGGGRGWTLACLAAILAGLAATQARGAWLAFAAAGAAFLAVRRCGWRTWLVLLGCALLAAGGAVLAASARPDWFGHVLEVKPVRGRVWIWAVSWEMIRDAPWLGFGLGSFGLHFPDYQARLFAWEGWTAAFLPNATFTPEAHNDYLQIWAETGILGLASFASLVWIAARRGRVLAGDPVALGFWAALISPLLLPGSLMLFAALLGAVEAASCSSTARLSARATPARAALVALVLAICGWGCWSGYRRLAGDAALQAASAALERGLAGEAGRAFKEAVRHAPNRMETHYFLSRSRLEERDCFGALAAVRRAAELEANVANYRLQADILEHCGQAVEAVAVLGELARLRPDLKWPRTRAAALAARGAANRTLGSRC